MTDRHIDPERAAFDGFKALPRDRPIEMLNLLRFRERAAYAEGDPAASEDLTGAEAYRCYARESGPVFARVGGTIIWSGAPECVLIGPADERWDAAFVAGYPSASAFLEMIADPAIARQCATARPRWRHHA